MRRIVAFFTRARDARGGDDAGMALASVIGLGAVLMILVATMASVSVSGSVKSAADRSWNLAIQAAYAGLADYQSRLTADNSYELVGNASAAFSGTSAFSKDWSANPAFATSGSRWAEVVNSGGRAQFRYEVDNTDYTAEGVVRVRVTGKAGGVTRSIVADLKGDGFVDYLYFTDYESSDPSITGETQDGDSSKLCIPQHYSTDGNLYDANKACSPVQFTKDDTLTGPVRTNDTFLLCGTTFTSTVQSTAGDGVFRTPFTNGSTGDRNCRATATFGGGVPKNVQSIDPPSTIANMGQEARTDDRVNVPRPGCLYTGPTSFVFAGNRVTIKSPLSQATQYKLNGSGKPQADRSGDVLCGSPAALRSASGATIPVLDDNLAYVQTVPTDPQDPNYTKPGDERSAIGTMCQVGQTYGNGLGYPKPNEYVGNAGANGLYNCRAGDAFVAGTVNGKMTVGAANFLYVTSNITYATGTQSVLGLVGQRAVTVYNPISCNKYQTTRSNNQTITLKTCDTATSSTGQLQYGAGSNITINAAIASNTGTFQVQNNAYGPRMGDLTVLGSIAQKFRGTVGVTYSTTDWRGQSVFDHQTGFTKNYGYDNRFQSIAPPKFLQPVSTSYGITTQVEVNAAYRADGSCARASSGDCQ
ncbi:hypothetical protein [Curtobacterium sp. MCPF17_046]|uniref:hypothetical protein n=1 Tax=Curtobacterium sp. MCPF17_046 TaxID=2175663 RepID=UPI000D868773|nr:hypothetical protein [Curtobacterium sp. MCPF17_046]PYY41530.1 hypothetical protein DEJ32_04070 [Curtobacterium sp. MCPF17_046]